MQLKELANKRTALAPGYRTCSGCPITTIVRHVLRATDDPVVVAVNTGCLEVTTSIYPQTSWKVTFVHSLLENAAATISGLEAAAKAMKRSGKIPAEKNIKFVVFAGDGSTYDAGLQFLSAAIERGHDFLYVCYDNEAYMNTGVQKSGATPVGASTTTTPPGEAEPAGHDYLRKDLTRIIAAHGIKYAAQAALLPWQDFYEKAQKGLAVRGPAFLNVFSPCIPGWKIDTSAAIDLSRQAVETRFWPLYEVEEGKYKITVPVDNPKPLDGFLKEQGRFKHLFTPEGADGLRELKESVARRWQEIKNLQDCSK